MTIKQSIVRHIISLGDVSLKCAELSVEDYKTDRKYEYRLPVDYTQEQIDKFMDELDYTIKDHFYMQIRGTLWFTDSSFSIYMDGWVYNHAPEIPKYLHK